MSKKQSKRGKNRKIIITLIIVLGLITVAAFALFVLPLLTGEVAQPGETGGETTALQTQATEQTDPTVHTTAPAGSPVTEPSGTETAETEPAQPSQTQPQADETAAPESEPAATEPAPTEPEQTKPQETEPAQTQPRETEAPETEPPETAVPETQAPVVEIPAGEMDTVAQFPLTLEGGKLEIENLLQYEGINPDCGYEDGRDTAAIILKNRSGSHLAVADIELELTDGTSLHFRAEHIPAGMSVMAFEIRNQQLPDGAACGKAGSSAEFVSAPPGISGVSASFADMIVTVVNSGQNRENLVIHCHSFFDEGIYFGGLTNKYTVETLPAQETVMVEAFDSLTGLADVICITTSEE